MSGRTVLVRLRTDKRLLRPEERSGSGPVFVLGRILGARLEEVREVREVREAAREVREEEREGVEGIHMAVMPTAPLNWGSSLTPSLLTSWGAGLSLGAGLACSRGRFGRGGGCLACTGTGRVRVTDSSFSSSLELESGL